MPQLNPLAFAIGVIIAFSPIYFPDMGDPGHWPVALALSIGVLAWLLRSKVRGNIQVPVVTWLFFLLIGWALIGRMLADIHVASIANYAVIRLMGYGGILLAGLVIWQQKHGPSQLISAMSGFSMALALTHTIAYAVDGMDGLIDPYLVPGLMGHKNFTASAVAMGLPATILLIQHNKGHRRWLTTLAMIAVLSILLTQTRSLWLAMGVVGILTLFSLTQHKVKRLIWPLAMGALLLVGLMANSQIRERLTDDSNISMRQAFWQNSLEMVKEKPLIGVGPGQWQIHFPKHGLKGMDNQVMEGVTAIARPHNDIIWMLAEHGWPGGLLYLACFIAWMVLWWNSRGGQDRSLHWALGSSLAILVVFAQFSFPLERAAVMIPFLLMMGGLSAKRSWPLPAKALKALALLLIGTLAYSAYHGVKSNEANQAILQANERQQAIPIQQAVQAGMSSWNEVDRFGNPLPYFEGMGRLIQEAGGRQTFGPKDFQQTERLYQQALSLHPWHAVTLHQYGNLFRYRQQWQQAVSMYEQLLAISPRHPQGQLYLASSHLQLQQAEQAATVLIALCNPAITQTEAYQSMVLQALRSCPEKVQHKGLQAVLDQTINTKNDQALLAYFQRHQAAVIAEQQRR